MNIAEQLHPTVNQLHNFLDDETGLSFDDGAHARDSLRSQLWVPHNHEGTVSDYIAANGSRSVDDFVELYGPSSTQNPRHNDLQAIGTVMRGVFVAASLTPRKTMPAIIAPRQENGEVTLFMSRKEWRAGGITETQRELLSAAAQLEAPGVGEHSTQDASSAEAQHLITQFGIAHDTRAQVSWQQGQHINHTDRFKKQGTLSVTSPQLLGEDGIITARVKQDPAGKTLVALNDRPFVEAPHFALYWHAQLQAENAHGTEIGDSTRALTIVQALGYRAVVSQNTLPAVRQMLQS